MRDIEIPHMIHGTLRGIELSELKAVIYVNTSAKSLLCLLQSAALLNAPKSSIFIVCAWTAEGLPYHSFGFYVFTM